MTITGGSALPKDDIERMKRDAEDHAEEDKRLRDAAEARNVADQLVWQTEKFLAESGDKLPEENRTEINEALGELRSALGGQDLEKIKDAHEKLASVSQKAGTMMYQQAQESASASAGGESTAKAGGQGDDVVDAEIIDEDGKA